MGQKRVWNSGIVMGFESELYCLGGASTFWSRPHLESTFPVCLITTTISTYRDPPITQREEREKAREGEGRRESTEREDEWVSEWESEKRKQSDTKYQDTQTDFSPSTVPC